MIATAALAVESGESLLAILAVATLAALLADLLWYACGRRLGTTVLRLMCKLSLSPDSCVALTQRVYGRWGSPSLIVAKYVPGLAAVVTTLAGQTGTSLRRFIFFDVIGAMLWAGGAIALGAVFHEAVGLVLLQLEALGHYAAALLIAVLILFVLAKWWQRHRFLLKIRMSRISVPELGSLLESGQRPTILDVRGPDTRSRHGWIPGSIALLDPAELPLEPDQDMVVYCDCPNDASAAVIALKLRDRGFTRVRPLAGGFEAWQGHGYPLEREQSRAP